jgi:hypothetical protein
VATREKEGKPGTEASQKAPETWYLKYIRHDDPDIIQG